MIMNTNSKLIVISGPSGVGKDSIIEKMCEDINVHKYIVTVTTREKRPGEIDGNHYHFITKSSFDLMIENNELLEWAMVYGNYYGVPKKDVIDSLSKFETVIIKVDVQGALSIKKSVAGAIFIFIMPPSESVLYERLINRGYISEDDLQRRFSIARDEMNKIDYFDYVVKNNTDNIDLAVSDIKSIITAERCKVNPEKIQIQ
jgi:guanylate kinase